MEFAGDPVNGVGFAGVEGGFEGVGGAFTAEEDPVVVDGAGDDAGGLGGGGLVFGEGVFEEGEEIVGVFVFEEEGGGGAAVFEVVETGGGLRFWGAGIGVGLFIVRGGHGGVLFGSMMGVRSLTDADFSG